jgi:hypothetical protein
VLSGRTQDNVTTTRREMRASQFLNAPARLETPTAKGGALCQRTSGDGSAGASPYRIARGRATLLRSRGWEVHWKRRPTMRGVGRSRRM